MSLILSLDTATKACSVALWQDNEVLAQRVVIEDGYTHAEQLHVLIDEIVKETEITFNDIEAIAVGKGPGSYTGLRIGVSTAKGLAYSVDVPLISLPSLQIMAVMAGIEITQSEDCLLRPLLDARRMEVYSAAYDILLVEQEACAAHIIDEQSFAAELESGIVYFFGDGMMKCKEVLSRHKNARFIEGIFPSAAFMGPLANDKLQAGLVEDVAYFEPYYLKEFIAKPPKKML